MTDELRRRLRRLDPMPPEVHVESPTTPSSRALLEEIMSTKTDEQTDRSPDAARPRWLAGVAAVAVMAIAVAGGIALSGGEDPADPVVAQPPIELDAAGEDMMASCIRFSVEELRRVAEIAFEGTVAAVDGPTVTLDVDRWFLGGDTSQVVLHAPEGMEALIGGIPFETGEQYLVTAQGGGVNYCGFSGPSSPELRTAFEEAFAG